MDRAERKLARRRERGGSEVYGPVWLKDTVVMAHSLPIYEEIWRLSRVLVDLPRRLFGGQARIGRIPKYRYDQHGEWQSRFVWPSRRERITRRRGKMREFGPVKYLY